MVKLYISLLALTALSTSSALAFLRLLPFRIGIVIPNILSPRGDLLDARRDIVYDDLELKARDLFEEPGSSGYVPIYIFNTFFFFFSKPTNF